MPVETSQRILEETSDAIFEEIPHRATNPNFNEKLFITCLETKTESIAYFSTIQ